MKMEADEKMVLAGILHWDREDRTGICMLKRCMHATFKCPHAYVKNKTKKNLAYFSNAQKSTTTQTVTTITCVLPLGVLASR